MSTPSAQAMSPGQSIPWTQVWLQALTRPNEQSYHTLLSDPGATPTRGLLWVGVTSLFGTAIALVTQLAFRPEMSQVMGQLDRELGAGARAGSFLLLLLCAVPLGAVLSVLSTVIYTALVNFIAGALGGTGNFNQLVYLFSAITAPMGVVTSLLGVVPIVACLTLPLVCYSLYLQLLAVKTVHQVDWVRAAASVLILIILAVVIAAVCSFALLVPVFQEAMRGSF